MKKYYYGAIRNSKIKQSASGGIAYALYKKTLDEGGIIYGVKWTEDYFGAQYVRITKKSDTSIEVLQGSKYIRATLRLENGLSVYESILNDLNQQLKVLFIGLPCEVQGLIRYLENKKKNRTNLLTVDLICHGTTKKRVLEQFIKRLKRKYKSDVKYFSLRQKNPNWGESYVMCTFRNGKQFLRKLQETDFGIAYNIMSETICYDCNFRGNNRLSDITIGDYWGASRQLRKTYARGLSLIITNNIVGDSFIRHMDGVDLGTIDSEAEAIKGNPYYSVNRIVDYRRDSFVKRFDRFGLHIACMKAIGLKGILRNYYPNVYMFLKKIVRNKNS